MRTRFCSEDDGWTADGRKITAPEALDAVRRCLDADGPVIVEHWFYRGSCARTGWCSATSRRSRRIWPRPCLRRGCHPRLELRRRLPG